MRVLQEEFITKCTLSFLRARRWRVLAFDYPQSGTGVSLQPEDRSDDSSKNLGVIIPDVVAVKGQTLLILESKPAFYAPDVEKLRAVKRGQYSRSIRTTFRIYKFNIRVGIVLGDNPQERARALSQRAALDAVLWVDGGGDVHEAHLSFDL